MCPISSQFNRAGGKYDFRQCDMGKLREEVVELENKQKAQKKKVNYKVVNMIDELVLFYLFPDGC